MNPTLQNCVRALSILVLATTAANGQLVSVRTAPVTVSEQFFTFPSRLLGMGGGLALHDIEMDPFANPAAGARLRGGLITGSPTHYNRPTNDGFGRTLPVAILWGGTDNFAVASFAMQELESAHLRNQFFGTPVVRNDRFSHNKYGFGMLGTRLPGNHGALAFSASYSKLEAVHAVDLLYPQAEAIDQKGAISDFRAGYLREISGDRELEAVVVRNHVDMEHTVTYVDRRWVQPSPQQPGNWVTSIPREEFNRDKTTTWGAHLKYSSPIAASKWRLAGAFTTNLKTHPKIPNYEFMSIPRDPGDSWAIRFGIGAAKVDSVSTWAFDISYEPAWTYTWAEAAADIHTARGDTIRKGAMTVENDFVFSNTNYHVGWMRRMDQTMSVQLGLGFRHISYYLDQFNHITNTPREQDESWVEMNLSWGLALAFGGMELRYFGRRTGGLPQLAFASEDAMVVAPQPDVDIVAAPSGPLNMDVTTVHTHQLSVSIPFGRRR